MAWDVGSRPLAPWEASDGGAMFGRPLAIPVYGSRDRYSELDSEGEGSVSRGSRDRYSELDHHGGDEFGGVSLRSEGGGEERLDGSVLQCGASNISPADLDQAATEMQAAQHEIYNDAARLGQHRDGDFGMGWESEGSPSLRLIPEMDISEAMPEGTIVDSGSQLDSSSEYSCDRTRTGVEEYLHQDLSITAEHLAFEQQHVTNEFQLGTVSHIAAVGSGDALPPDIDMFTAGMCIPQNDLYGGGPEGALYDPGLPGNTSDSSQDMRDGWPPNTWTPEDEKASPQADSDCDSCACDHLAVAKQATQAASQYLSGLYRQRVITVDPHKTAPYFEAIGSRLSLIGAADSRGESVEACLGAAWEQGCPEPLTADDVLDTTSATCWAAAPQDTCLRSSTYSDGAISARITSQDALEDTESASCGESIMSRQTPSAGATAFAGRSGADLFRSQCSPREIPSPTSSRSSLRREPAVQTTMPLTYANSFCSAGAISARSLPDDREIVDRLSDSRQEADMHGGHPTGHRRMWTGGTDSSFTQNCSSDGVEDGKVGLPHKDAWRWPQSRDQLVERRNGAQHFGSTSDLSPRDSPMATPDSQAVHDHASPVRRPIKASCRKAFSFRGRDQEVEVTREVLDRLLIVAGSYGPSRRTRVRGQKSGTDSDGADFAGVLSGAVLPGDRTLALLTSGSFLQRLGRVPLGVVRSRVAAADDSDYH